MVDILLQAEEFSARLAELASQIRQDLVGGERASRAAFIGIQRRGVSLAHRLALAVQKGGGAKLPVGTLDITFYRDDLTQIAQQPVVGGSELPFDVTDQKIYLVDDVLYTGRTIRAALEAILAYGRPRVIRLLVLVDRGQRELPIQPDWTGIAIKTQSDDNVKVAVMEIDGRDEVTLERA